MPQISSWQNDAATRDLTMGFRGPVSEGTTSAWLRGLADPGARSGLPTRFVFGIHHQSTLAGIVQLHTVDWLQRTAMLGITVGREENRGQGVGYAASALLLDYGFNGLDLHRVALSVLACNQTACRLYEQLGFAAEGLLRKAYFADGARHDVSLYGLLRDDWCSPLPATAVRLLHRFDKS